MPRAKLYGVPTGNTSMRVARTLLALHAAGDRGILAPDLIDRVGTSKPTLYRVLQVARTAGWRIDSRPEMVDGLRFARLSLARSQRLPRDQAAPPELNRSRRE